MHPARLLSLVLLLAAIPASAQQMGRPMGSVTGSIVDDATGEPLPQATVALYASRDTSFVTGAAADLNGVFRVESVPPGSYQIRVSYVGYQSRRRNDAVIQAGVPLDVGVVRLSPAAAELGEALVAGRREFVEQQADRTVYNVQEQAVTAGGSAIETLQTLPSLEVDTDGNISLRGNQNVVIQINGRPVPVRGAFLAALLRQIPADKVSRVEVVPNPSAKYEPDGMGGIVNIVLAEGTDRGLSGGVTLGGGTLPNGTAGANLSYQKGKWDLNGQYGFRYDERGGISGGTVQNLVRNQETVQAGENNSEFISHFLSGSATYSLAQGTTLSTQGSMGLRSGDSNGLTSSLSSFNGAGSQSSERTQLGASDGYNGDLAVVFRRQFADAGASRETAPSGNPGMGFRGGRGGFGGPGGGGGGTQSGHELAIESRYTRNNGDDTGLFTDAFSLGQSIDRLISGRQRTSTDQTTDETSAQVDYTRPLGTGKLEVGSKATYQTVVNDLVYERDRNGQFVVDAGQTNAFEFSQQILAGYLQGARALGNVQVQAGVRAEYASRSFDLRTEPPTLPGIPPIDDSAGDVDYFSLFPSVFATYALGPGSLVKASYRRSIDRPRTFSLNPFPSFEDTTFIRVGNPTLRPEYTNSFDLTLQYKFFATLTPFYRRTTDVINRFAFTDPATGVTTFTSRNFDTQESYGADLTLAYRSPAGKLSGFVNGSLYQKAISGDVVAGASSAKGTEWRVTVNLSAELTKRTKLQAFTFYNGPRVIANGSSSGFAFSNIGLSHQISDNLQFAARVEDPFSTSRFEFTTNTGQTFSNRFFDPNQRQVSATLTYTFGSNQRRPQQQPQQPQGGDGGFGF